MTCGFYKSPDVVLGCRIRTSSLRKGKLFHAPPVQQPWQAIVSFDAARLIINSVLLVALLSELLLDSPRLYPHGRVLDGDLVFEGVGAGPRPALDQVQVLARALKIGLRAEVRHVDNERIAVPIAARIAVPLPDVGRQVGTPVHDDVPLPALTLTHVIEHRDAAWRLHDPPEAPAERRTKLGQTAGQAAVG